MNARSSLQLVSAAALLFAPLAGCAQVPISTRGLPWVDARGDRGVGVRDRDLAQCADLVEQRRPALAGCMAQKGWTLAP